MPGQMSRLAGYDRGPVLNSTFSTASGHVPAPRASTDVVQRADHRAAILACVGLDLASTAVARRTSAALLALCAATVRPLPLGVMPECLGSD